jgi:quinoprotein glucose dehydrogenase
MRGRLGQTCAAAIALLAAACGRPAPLDFSGPTADWPEYAGDKGGLHYSPLTQVTRANVARLELVWSHHSGDFSAGSATSASTAFQVTPLVVNDTLYYCTPYMRVFALDPETGAERWSFDPVLKSKATGGPYPLTCRGVAYWEQASASFAQRAEGERRPSGRSAQRAEGERRSNGWPACSRRILYGTRDSELIALDASTGQPCAEFGVGGRVALREGIGGSVPDWEYYPTSPPLVIGDVAVIGALVADQLKTDAPSGVVRAFDVRTGRLVWAWDPVPPGWKPDPPEGESYKRGKPNVWSLLSGDPERGLVFVPTGNP